MIVRLIFGTLFAIASSAALANAQTGTCAGPACNSTHSGCEYKQSQNQRACCCDVDCDQLGCECINTCFHACGYNCPADPCNACPGGLALNSEQSTPESFVLTAAALQEVRKQNRFVGGLLAGLSRKLKRPIVSTYAQGGTSHLAQPLGARYKLDVVARSGSLVLNVVFLPVEPPEGSTLPPSAAPDSMRVDVNAAGAIAISPLGGAEEEALRKVEPRACNEKAQALIVALMQPFKPFQ